MACPSSASSTRPAVRGTTKTAPASSPTIYAIGRQAVIPLPQLENGLGTALELIEAKDQGYEGFERLMGVCRLMAQIALLGGNLTSEVHGGSRAAATVHSDEFRALLKSDGQSLSTFLREACWEPWAEAHYGDARLAPWGCWDVDPPADLKAEGESFKALGEGVASLEASGLDVDAEALAERFGIPLKVKAEAGEGPAQDGGVIKAKQVFEYHFKYRLLTVNEGRATIGLPPIPGGDVIAAEAPKPEPGSEGGAPKPPAGDDDGGEPGAEGGEGGEGDGEPPPKAALAALSASPPLPRGAVAGQAYVDELAETAAAAGALASRGWLARVAATLARAESPEALRAGLVELAASVPDEGLAGALERAQLLASLAGMASVRVDLGGDAN